MKRCIIMASGFLLLVAGSAMAAGDLKVTVSGNGQVNSNPLGKISCRQGAVTGCTTMPWVATTITLTATPDTGNVFVGWSGACSGNSPTCQVKGDSKSQVQVTATFNWRNIYLLLHGMNSDATTWNDLVKAKFGRSCQLMKLGEFTEGTPADTQCFRVNFATRGSWAKGDGATFSELGDEVNSAVTAILSKYPSSVITLVGHSRGGLAARAFLQRCYSSCSNSPSKVIGLLTIGTPHQGSPLGRMYTWLETHPEPSKRCKKDGQPVYCATGNPPGNPPDSDIAKDWEAARFLKSHVDITSPTVKYLATGSNEINTLNQGASKLDKNIRYAQIVSTVVQFGDIHSLYNVWGGSMGVKDTSQSAKNYILNGNSRESYIGDGIVPITSQRLSALTVFGFSVPPRNVINTELTSAVRHTEETGRLTEIINALDTMAK